ncbi:hypothetical protein GGTG_08804 [Gaeumannomyces tritici R3-111a-1]|uniref:Uncharacterized protein n=1 Tax=Gaeumannomyces tritici (strain R3-111a-1) TaxID=644352 RepID=J3P5L4_GAET3|nr:hypothetical protein GGTG_08804 [Gaeumannomyces tritici R3-111a-1]EJT74966.1 hypothetical protein GGTG_08804 [Gaeumannomyces tritici R3-111a-1]
MAGAKLLHSEPYPPSNAAIDSASDADVGSPPSETPAAVNPSKRHGMVFSPETKARLSELVDGYQPTESVEPECDAEPVAPECDAETLKWQQRGLDPNFRANVEHNARYLRHFQELVGQLQQTMEALKQDYESLRQDYGNLEYISAEHVRNAAALEQNYRKIMLELANSLLECDRLRRENEEMRREAARPPRNSHASDLADESTRLIHTDGASPPGTVSSRGAGLLPTRSIGPPSHSGSGEVGDSKYGSRRLRRDARVVARAG